MVNKFNVRAAPTLILLNKSLEVTRLVGAHNFSDTQTWLTRQIL